MIDRVFTSGEFEAVTGLHPRVRDGWDKIDFLSPSERGRTGQRGVGRLYGFNDLVAGYVAKLMRERGVEVKALRPLVAFLQQRPQLDTVMVGTVLNMRMDPEQAVITEKCPVLFVPGILWTGPKEDGSEGPSPDPYDMGFSLMLDLEIVVRAVKREIKAMDKRGINRQGRPVKSRESATEQVAEDATSNPGPQGLHLPA